MIVRGILYLPKSASPSSSTSWLLDAAGRRVTELHPGANDVRALAPGVYFVRFEPSSASRKQPAVTKVIVTE